MKCLKKEAMVSLCLLLISCLTYTFEAPQKSLYLKYEKEVSIPLLSNSYEMNLLGEFLGDIFVEFPEFIKNCLDSSTEVLCFESCSIQRIEDQINIIGSGI